MPNNCLSVLYKHIIQVENKNVVLKVVGHTHTIAPPPPPPNQKCGGHISPLPPPPPPSPLPTPVNMYCRVCIAFYEGMWGYFKNIISDLFNYIIYA